MHQQPQRQRHVQAPIWSHFFFIRHGVFLQVKRNTLQKDKWHSSRQPSWTVYFLNYMSKILLLLMNQLLNLKKNIYSVWINKNKKHIDRLPECNELFLVINPKSLGLWADGWTEEAIWRSDLDYFPPSSFDIINKMNIIKLLADGSRMKLIFGSSTGWVIFSPFFPFFFLCLLWSSTQLTQTTPLFIRLRPLQLQEMWNASFAVLNKIFSEKSSQILQM